MNWLSRKAAEPGLTLLAKRPVDMTVRSAAGDLRQGVCQYPDTDSDSFTLDFDPPLQLDGYTSAQESFRKATGQRVLWGQGRNDDYPDWCLVPDDTNR